MTTDTGLALVAVLAGMTAVACLYRPLLTDTRRERDEALDAWEALLDELAVVEQERDSALAALVSIREGVAHNIIPLRKVR